MRSKITPARSMQIHQLVQLGSDIIRNALTDFGIDNVTAQRIIEYEEEFTAAIRTAAMASLRNLSVSEFKNEEVETYNEGYTCAYPRRKITEQMNTLRQLFPSIEFADNKIAEQKLPPGAEGWFAIPQWQALAPTYGEAVEKVLAKIDETRKFKNSCEGELGPNRLRQLPRTERMLQALAQQQGGSRYTRRRGSVR